MADIRIKDLGTTASVTASDDFMAVDGTTNGTRKLSAATPAFLTSVTTPSLTSPAATALTLGTTDSGAAITVLAASNNVGIGTITPAAKLEIAGTYADEGTDRTPATVQKLSVITGGGGDGATYFKTGWSNSANSGIFTVGVGYYSGGSQVRDVITLRGSTGDVSIPSTTAGSANAGALVLQGGISAGNTGSVASYFGGNVTVKSDNTKLQVEGNTASNSTQFLIRNPTTDFYVALDNSTGGSFGKPNAGLIWLTSANKLVFATNNSQRMEISSAGDITATGAATFAGAVAIANTVSSVSPTSPNRTITMVVGGVTLYIAAKTTND